MAEARVPPEEKLLKIIENPHDPVVRGKVGFKVKEKKPVLFPGWLGELKKIKEGGGKGLLSMQNANKGMAGLCVLITFFSVIAVLRENNDFKIRFGNLIKAQDVLSNARGEKKFPSLDMPEITSDANKRNIFTLASSIQEVPLMPAEAAQTIGNLKLVGIIWSDSPQAMIENAQEQKTYLLSEGEQIGQIKIRKVSRDSVTISKDEQEWVLR